MRNACILICMLLNLSVFAQIEDTTYIFTNLQEALKNPEQVYKLNLRKQKLKKIPNEINHFNNLVWLDVSKNKITYLDSTFNKLEQLKYLNVSKNGMQLIDHSLGNLSSLEYLIINQNNLKSLPKEIGQLKKLKYIDAWSNEFGDLPKELNDCENLKIIDLRVILFTESKQKELIGRYPNIKLLMSPGCNCGN